jgi:hypothetical protein
MFLSEQKCVLHLYGIFAHNSIFMHMQPHISFYFPYLLDSHIQVYISECLSLPSLSYLLLN